MTTPTPQDREKAGTISDPIESLVYSALINAGIKVELEQEPANLDFYLPDQGVYIEVKQFHSYRISEQMSRVKNVIAIQGRDAAQLFAELFAEHLRSANQVTEEMVELAATAYTIARIEQGRDMHNSIRAALTAALIEKWS